MRLLRVNWSTLLIIAVLAALYLPGLVAHMRLAADTYRINDDARAQIYPFYRYHDDELFRADPIADYYLSAFVPRGFKLLYGAWSTVADPATLSKALPYLLLLVTVIAVALATYRVGGLLAAFCAAAIALGSGLLLGRMGGGLPRSFAYPVVALALAALATGRVRHLVWIVWLGAAFYPAAAAIAGLSFAAFLFLIPRADRGDASEWSVRKRLVVLALTAAVAAVIVAPQAMASRAYGGLVHTQQMDRFPEASPEGRFGPDDRPPHPGLFDAVFGLLRYAVGEKQQPAAREESSSSGGVGSAARQRTVRHTITDVVFMLLVGLWIALFWHAPAARRTTALLLAVVAGHFLSRILWPYLFSPQRYILYGIPPLIAIAFASLPLACASVAERLGRPSPPKARLALALAWTGLVVLALTAIGRREAGLEIDEKARAPLYEAIAALPKTALIAGWPGKLEPIDSVPYLSRRAALVTYESHQVFHPVFIEQMRRRTRALVDAYFATSLAPIARLRDEFAVTHFLLDLRHLEGPAPPYFQPFRQQIERRQAGLRHASHELLKPQHRSSLVFRLGSYRLFDLRALHR